MKPIVITNYSDPVCVWCWGTEPIFRAMETHYPDLFSIRYVMGGMVRDLSDFNDEENGIGRYGQPSPQWRRHHDLGYLRSDSS